MMLGIPGCALDGPLTVHPMIVGGLDGLFVASQPVPYVTMSWFLLTGGLVRVVFGFGSRFLVVLFCRAHISGHV